MLRHPRNALRLLRIVLILLGYGVITPWRQAPQQRGKRLARALEAMGPSFIKLGQAFSTRSDLVGREMAQELATLQDKLPPFEGKTARAIIEHEMEATLDTLFTSFDDKAVAAASVAQVHFAITKDGREVAVKLLRPGINEAFARDIGLFYWLAGLVDYFRPDLARLHLGEVVRQMEDTVRFETDLRMEAAAASRLRENLKGDAGFYVPQVYWDLTAHRMLTLERIHGTPVNDVAAIRASGHNLSKLVDIAATSFFNQVFRDGFFHADMHPGNLFVRADGSLAVVDFGIMGRLDKPMRVFLAHVLHGFLTEDYHGLAKVHFDLGIVPPHKSQEAFELALMAITKPIIGKALKDISFARLFGQLIATAESFEMEAQPQLLLLHKNMLITEGVGLMLNPEVNMWQVAEPLVQAWAMANLGPRARVKEHARETLTLLKSLPSLVKDAERILQNPAARETNRQDMLREMRKKNDLQRRFLWLGWAALILFGLVHVIGV